MTIGLVELLEPLDVAVLTGAVFRLVEGAEQRAAQDVVDEGRLAATRLPCDTGEAADRKVRIDILQVVLRGADDAEPSGIQNISGRLCGRGDAPFGDGDRHEPR